MEEGEDIIVAVRGHEINQAGIYRYTKSITLSFAETVDNSILRWLKLWRESAWRTGTGQQSRMEDLEAGITLQLLDRQDEPIWNFTLIGCYYRQGTVGADALDGETSDIRRPDLILTYDYFKDWELKQGGDTFGTSFSFLGPQQSLSPSGPPGVGS